MSKQTQRISVKILKDSCLNCTFQSYYYYPYLFIYLFIVSFIFIKHELNRT